jgi:hypothetical protein
MPTEFPALADRIVDALLDADPLAAHHAGDHGRDDRLADLSADAVAARSAMLRDASHSLSEVDDEELSAEDQVDHAMLMTAVDARLFALTETRDHEWNPLAHNPGPLLDALITQEFAPADHRLALLVERLAEVPDALATARATLTDCPAVHVQTAVGQFTGVADLIRAALPDLVRQVPKLAGHAKPAQQAALAALDEFVEWLRARQSAPGREPRLGRRHWEAKLWYTLDTPLPAAELMRRAWQHLDDTTDRIREAAAELTGGRPTDATVREALDQLAAEHPGDATIVPLAVATLAETTKFVEQFELVSTVDDLCVVREMPEFARGVSAAYCDAPGPLETAELPTLYAIAPPPADWPAERAVSFYREYNVHMVANLTAHEAMPGHFLQLAHARRFTGSSRVRALCASGTFIEGWAVYAEQLMADHGYGGLPVRLQQLKMQLRVTINAILDQAVHCDGMTEEEAMALMAERGFQEEGEAAGKWRRALLTSTQLSTYFVGFTEMSAIAAARPTGTALRAWHNAMLSHGSPSPRHLRTLLLG